MATTTQTLGFVKPSTLGIAALILVAFVGVRAKANANNDHDRQLTAAMAQLASVRQERDSAVASQASIEQNSQKIEGEMSAIADKVDQFEHTRNGWSDDIRANIRDVDPTSIELMVRESNQFVGEMKSADISDTPSSYQSAVSRYISACQDLELAESKRLRIDYLHLNLISKVSEIDDSNLSESQQKELRQDQRALDLGAIATWTAMNSDNNILIDRATSAVASATSDLASERQSAPQAIAAQIQDLKNKVDALNLSVSEAETKVKSLGGGE